MKNAKMVKWLLWQLPSLVHKLVLGWTGWRMYQEVYSDGEIDRYFTKMWPIPFYALDDGPPPSREAKID
jgi:hypothetical protein